MTDSKSIPKRCPICKGTELSICQYDSISVGYEGSAGVYCENCGEIGTVQIRIVPKNGTFYYMNE